MSLIPNILVIGEPGSGKSVGTGRLTRDFPGAVVIQDPHRNSLAELGLLHVTGNVLFDRVSDLQHSLGYGLLRHSRHSDEQVRMQQNLKRARLVAECR